MTDRRDTFDPRGSAADQSADLTILTVCVKKHYDYLHRHIALMDRLNPGVRWRLIVVDNSSTEESEFVSDDDRVTVRPGVPLDLSLPENCRFSYHHATALNANLQGIDSRYLLIIDPDMFVVYPNWMEDVMTHMERRSLCFFGTPWHPRWFNKYRYYPAVHFLLVDLRRVPAAKLDVRPELVEMPNWSKRHTDSKHRLAKGIPRAGLVSYLRWRLRKTAWRLVDRIYRVGYIVFSRALIGTSRDTGWKIWEQFGKTGRYPAEIVLPVVDVAREFRKPLFLSTWRGWLLERLLPARYCFLPKPGTYVTPAAAAGFRSPEFKVLHPEAFVWRGAAFAFHLRHHVRDEVWKRVTGDDERTALATILNRAGLGQLEVQLEASINQ